MAKIDLKRTVNVEFIGSGLDKLEKSLDSITSKVEDKQGVAQANKLKSDILLMKKVLEEGSNEVSEEVFKNFQREFQNMFKAFDRVRRSIKPTVNVESNKELEQLEKEITALETRIENLKSERTSLRRNASEGKTSSPSDWKVSKVFQENTFRKIADENFEEGEILSPTGRPTKSLKTYEATLASIRGVLAQVNLDEEKILATVKEKGTASEEDLKALQVGLEASKSKLTAEQAITQLVNSGLISQEQQRIYAEEINKGKQLTEEINRDVLELEEKRKIELEKIAELEKSGEVDPTVVESIKNRNKAYDEYQKGVDKANKSKEEFLTTEKALPKAVAKTDNVFAQATKTIISSALIFQTLKRMYREAIRTITELDKSLTNMVIVTTMTRKQALNLVPALQSVARETGVATTEVAKLTTEFLKQGRSLSDAIELTEVAAKAARIAGISAQESVMYLTAAINGFGLAASDAMAVSDKFAALAAASATDYNELAVGLSKFASQAKVAGLSMDFALGLLTKGIDTTREAPESIGTALKTVLARMRELTDLGKTFEDGMSVNRVETALGQIGVNLRDTTGQFRDMEDVITEVGMRWNTLNKNQQASVAVAMAGTRQQSRLLAIFQDFDKTLQFVQTSEESAGETLSQHAAYMQGMEAAMAQLQTSWQQFITTIVDSEFIISIIRGIGGAIKFVADTLDSMGEFVRAVLIVSVGLLGVYKTLTIVTGILAAIEEKRLATGKANIVLDKAKLWWGELYEAMLRRTTAGQIAESAGLKLNTVGWWAKFKAMAATLAIYVAIVAVVGLLVFGAVKLIQSIKEENKSLKEKTEAYKLARYESQKLVKSYDDLIKRYDELSKKVIKTDEDIEAMRALGSELESIEGLNVVYTVRGDVDIEKTLEELEELRAAKREEQRKLDEEQLKNIQKEATKYKTIQPYRDEAIEHVDQIKTLYKGSAYGHAPVNAEYWKMVEQKQLELLAERGDISEIQKASIDLMIRDFERSQDVALTNEQVKMLEKYYNTLFSPEVFSQINTEDFLGIFRDQTIRDLPLIEEAYNELSLATEKGVENLIKTYNNQDLSEEIKKVIDSQFPMAEYLSNVFSGQDGSIDIFKGIPVSLDMLETFGRVLGEEEENIDDILQRVVRRYNTLLKYNPELASTTEGALLLQSQAWSDVASQIDNAVVKTQLYGMASVRTIQEIGQELDLAQSRLDSVAEKQQKYLKGELTNQELFSFVEDYADVFGKKGVLEDFLAGRDISGALMESFTKSLTEAEQSLLTINKRLEETDLSETEQETLTKQRNTLILMTRYRGELADTTKVRYEANKALEAYNRLSEIGIQNLELELELINRTRDATAEKIQKSNNDIEKYQREILDKFGDGYYEVVNGVIKLTEKAADELGKTQLQSLEKQLNFLQEAMDLRIDTLLEQAKLEIKIEKEKADKKKKIYEDYFKELERIEDRQEREQSREDIVTQLQRLQGATDAASRQRAKELQSELIEMDKKNSKDFIKDSRSEFLNSITKPVDDLTTAWNTVLQNLILGGYKSGEEFIQALKDAGFNYLGKNWEDKVNVNETPQINNYIEAPKIMVPGGKFLTETVTPYAKGGLVDYTGPAMVHGSTTRPEAVLSPEQTQMFFGLRDALSSINLGGENAAAITIEQILIQPQSMNSNQDFRKAGNQLAEAFRVAINGRGINLNTKR